MKLIYLTAMFAFTLSLTSCKSGDKCGDCPKFSKIENARSAEQI